MLVSICEDGVGLLITSRFGGLVECLVETRLEERAEGGERVK
jgi:hypothetical protein